MYPQILASTGGYLGQIAGIDYLDHAPKIIGGSLRCIDTGKTVMYTTDGWKEIYQADNMSASHNKKFTTCRTCGNPNSILYNTCKYCRNVSYNEAR
jgi:hypothetical protein